MNEEILLNRRQTARSQSPEQLLCWYKDERGRIYTFPEFQLHQYSNPGEARFQIHVQDFINTLPNGL